MTEFFGRLFDNKYKLYVQCVIRKFDMQIHCEKMDKFDMYIYTLFVKQIWYIFRVFILFFYLYIEEHFFYHSLDSYVGWIGSAVQATCIIGTSLFCKMPIRISNFRASIELWPYFYFFV